MKLSSLLKAVQGAREHKEIEKELNAIETLIGSAEQKLTQDKPEEKKETIRSVKSSFNKKPIVDTITDNLNKRLTK